MKAKTTLIMQHNEKTGNAVIKMDRASGITQATITKRNDGYALGRVPGAGLKRFTKSEVIALLDNNAIYVISWGEL